MKPIVYVGPLRLSNRTGRDARSVGEYEFPRRFESRHQSSSDSTQITHASVSQSAQASSHTPWEPIPRLGGEHYLDFLFQKSTNMIMGSPRGAGISRAGANEMPTTLETPAESYRIQTSQGLVDMATAGTNQARSFSSASAAGLDEAGFWPVTSLPSLTTKGFQFSTFS